MVIDAAVEDVLDVAAEVCVTRTIGATGNVAGKVIARLAVKLAEVPAAILYGSPSITLVLSCAAVSVFPAVNVNLPLIS